jgi:topoisomerase-4 subunit A
MAETTDAGEIRDTELYDALSERYLSYALSTIMARSLPDVRDGLKPVHRRVLWTMRELRLDPAAAYRKCAKVVGDVMGNYHPHGDDAIYEALVRLAQDFVQRYPLIDGQGNFGNIDGDNPAAKRYTESRLTAVAQALLEGIGEDTVDFRPSYDGSLAEPVVLPARLPNLLANGASGIAVGMATSIPPHNLGELCDGLRLIIKQPDCSTEDLLAHVLGPDFPTGGVLVESPENIRQAYATGRGSFRLRARWAKEPLAQGAYQIVVTEIPYMVPKSRLIERIAQLLEEKKLPLLGDMREESAETIRLVFEPKTRNVDPEMLMESLFRASDLETRIPLNMNVLDAGGAPRVMSLLEAMRAFLDHRLVVLERRTRARLTEIERRLHVLAGFLIAYLNIDEVIKIIRFEDHPKPALIARWDLSDEQAEAILNLRLRSLHKLEQLAIEKETAALGAEKTKLEALLADPAKRWKAIDKELVQLDKEFGRETKLGKRRTEIGRPPGEIAVPVHALIEREPVTILCSAKGWIRTVKGHNIPAGEQRYKEGDGPRFCVEAQTTDRLLLFATTGRFYTLGIDKLPGGRGMGEPLRLMIDLANDADIVTLLPYREGRKLVLISSDGRGFVVAEEEAAGQTRAGKQVLIPGEGAVARWCLAATGDALGLLGENRKLLVLPLAEIPEMARGRGVILQKFRDGGLADVKMLTLGQGLSWQTGTRTRSEPDLTGWQTGRGSSGRMAPMGFPQKPVRFP